MQYETARRQIRRDVDEMWRYVRGELGALQKDNKKNRTPAVASRLEKMQEFVKDYHA